MYVIHLAAALQDLSLPTPQQAGPARHAQGGSAPASLLPGSQPAADQLCTQMQSSAAKASPANTDLLEKAFQLYQDTCLSSDAQHSWDGLVLPSLHAALTFHAPNTTQLLGDHAIDPEMFHQHAIAYIQDLGVAGSADKLSSIQQQTKKQSKRTNASAEACSSLYAAATAAVQVAYDRDLSQLESAIQTALQGAVPQQVAEPTAANAYAPDADISDTPVAEAQPSAEAQADQADAAQPEPMEIDETEPTDPAIPQMPHKQLLITLLAFLRKFFASWKALGSKGIEGLQGPANRAEVQSSDLLSR